MNRSKDTSGKQDSKLKNFSEVSSFNRLSDKDQETSSSITSGGDESYLNEDISDNLKPLHNSMGSK
jgi:hypothetical protein